MFRVLIGSVRKPRGILFRDTLDQFVQAGKQEPQNGRLVRTVVAENQVNRWRVPFQRARSYGRG